MDFIKLIIYGYKYRYRVIKGYGDSAENCALPLRSDARLPS